MMSHTFSINKILSILAITFVAIELMGCASPSYLTTSNPSEVVSEILEQLNSAIAVAKKQYGNSPEIASVQVDLQLGTASDQNLNFPLSLVFLKGDSSQSVLHRMSLTFIPKPVNDTNSLARANKPLVAAIEETYRSVALANSHFDFQNGSIQIQCTLENGLGISGPGNQSNQDDRNSDRSNSSDGQSNVQLTPIQLGVSSSKSSTQTITLNFKSSAAMTAETSKVNSK